jgi:hypothetical protein
MYHIFFIHSSVVGHLGCFQSLATVNNAAANMGVKVALLYSDLYSFKYMPQSGIGGLDDKSIFSFLKNILFSTVVALIYISTNSK